ncbi:hypothetical protein [Novosphingobium sp.]|uniref:DUF3617 domain-containing protein n=1 Tax=Novosphingobium sp. TaxID=1874826 RepID=UPI0025E6940D|nr:hypothetical protein [Novosphingobium sp.]
MPASADGQNAGVLDSIQSGNWELRLREPGAEPKLICAMSGRNFIQLRHSSDTCDRFVVSQSDTEVVIQYTCRGHGYGRTRILRETGRLLKIDSQGIANGLPFEFTAEARRVGDCGG